jgi:hypothetical protein
MSKQKRPLLIKTKDVQRVLELSDRQARRVVQHTRRMFHKTAMQPVSFAEFSAYTGIDLETIYQRLNL